MGRIDLHNHLLCALDDGATDLAESVAIARALVEAGYSDVVTTPHARPGLMVTAEQAATRRQEVAARLAEEGIVLALHPGGENHVVPELLDRVAKGEAILLANGPYLLIELPFDSPVPRFRELVFQLLLHKVRPIVAHPERCAHFTRRPDAAREAVEAGAFLQLEIGSLAGLYGGPAKRCAQALVDDGLVQLAASDIHHPKSGREILTAGLKALAKAVGPARLELYTEGNPAKVLAGDALEA